MSAAATAWVWRQIASGKVKNLAGRLVLLKLADRADDQGKCWPGHERTAADCDISEKGARKALIELEEGSLIVVTRRQDKAGRDLSNVYHLPINREGEHSTPRGEHSSPGAESGSGGTEQRTPESNSINLTKKTTTPPPLVSGSSDEERNQLPPPPPDPPPENGARCSSSGLIFHPRIVESSPGSIDALMAGVTGLDPGLAQAVVDEFTGAFLAGKISTSSGGWINTVCKRAKEGSFKPGYCIKIRDERTARIKREEEARKKKEAEAAAAAIPKVPISEERLAEYEAMRIKMGCQPRQSQQT